MRQAASFTHLPWWFITEPGQTDTPMVFTGAFLVLFTLTMGILMLRLSFLPSALVPPGQGQI